MNLATARANGKKVFAIIDGKSVFYRGYYAMPNLATSDGRPTGGVYGFMTMALELVKQIKPDYVAVAWDKPKTNIRRRKAIYDGYKANRHPAPPDFYVQVPILEELLKVLGWPLYQVDDYEADDIMGTLSQKANKIGIHTILISSDLDMLQLVDDDTEVYAMKKGLNNLEKFDVTAFEEKYGIKVSQYLDLKSLKGDPSDNIPGVPGIGEKTALTLLKDYGSLDNVYGHLEDIKPSLKDKLLAGKDSAYMSKELARIWCDAPVPLDLTATSMANLDRVKLRQMLKDLQFTSLLKRLPANMQPDPLALLETDSGLVDQSELAGLVFKMTTDLPEKLTDPLVVAIDGNRVLIGEQNGTGYSLTFNQGANRLTGHQVVAHDLKALARSFLDRNLPADFISYYDTKHAGFLLNSLKPTTTLTDYLSEQGLTMPQPVDYLTATCQLWQVTAAQLDKETKLAKLAYQVDFPLQLVLAKMEQRGVMVDTGILKDMSAKLAKEISLLEQTIWQQVGYEFNVSSPKQLSDALFTKLQLPPTTPKRNKSGNYPTGAKELAKLTGLHPIINLIIDYRELTKLKSTYVDALPRVIGPDGRIHTTLDQDVTATGRLSSSNPNLQNIPTRSDRGREIKRAFIATPGKVIVNADYAQFELRLAAALAGDSKMIAMFADETNDIHTMTAAEAYGISPNEVTPTQRRHAKVINFGVLYGMSPRGLAEATGMDLATAKAFIDRYFIVRKPIRDFIDQTIKQATTQGYVETLFGRRRPTPDVKSANFMVREAAKRAAANMPIQGTEADLMKMAMLKVEKIAGASQIMQVHDSIMVECDETMAEAVATQMKQVMENIYPELGVRLLVDVKIGQNWSEI